jgi:glycogen(starch) synthase
VRILVVSNLYPPHVLGGYEILCGQVVGALRARGHDVHVLTSTHGGRGGEPGLERRLALETPFDEPARRSRALRARVQHENAAVTRETLARVRPDRVFVWSQLRLTLGAAAEAERSLLPVAYTLNDEHLAGYLPARVDGTLRSSAAAVLDRWLAAGLTLRTLRMRHVTCISAALRAGLVEKGVPVAQARVIHQGIPIELFPARTDRAPIRSRARVLYAGQLHPYKGVHTLLEAAALLSRRPHLPALELTIAGDGPAEYKARLRALAVAAAPEVRFLGRVPQARLAELYRAHDAFVFPSTWKEPFGLTHLEAMASGTPVVSTDEGGPREFLEDGQNALVFRAGDAGHLALALERLLVDDALARRLSRGGRDCVERRFTLSRYVSDLEAFLEEAA